MVRQFTSPATQSIRPDASAIFRRFRRAVSRKLDVPDYSPAAAPSLVLIASNVCLMSSSIDTKSAAVTGVGSGLGRWVPELLRACRAHE
jgi:hypothetical protein